MEQYKIGFIGVGEMAGAILEGMLLAGTVSPNEVGLYNRTPEKLTRYEKQGSRIFPDIPSLVTQCKIVLIGVKPQDFAVITPQMKQGLSEDTILLSIMAGITGEQIQQAMDRPCKVVLAMPNTPMMVGKGATAFARVLPTTQPELEQVVSLFPGFSQQIEPDQLRAIIPVNGSAPAYIYYFAQSIIERAVQWGIDPDAALKLLSHTLIGSAEMMLQSGKTIQQLIDMVCSPGGATLEGMKALEQNGFKEILGKGVDATIRRAGELSGQKPDFQVITVEFGSPHYQELLKLREAVLRTPLGLVQTESDVELDHLATFFAVLQGDKLVGTGNVIKENDTTARFRSLVVDPTLQKGGVGRLLMEKMTEFAKEQGYQKAVLNARETAQEFYRKFGYREEGDYFTHATIPHIAMYVTL